MTMNPQSSPSSSSSSPLKRWLPLLGVGAAAIGGGLIVWHGSVTATPQERPAVTVAPPAAVPVAPVATPTTTALDGGVVPVEAPKTTATIVFTTVPATNARVMWGKKLLGTIGPKAPLYIVRPRDSGPLDVMILAPGYLPVQTRAHTFADNKLTVKLTPPDQKQTLWGYRTPLDAGVPLDPTSAEQLTPPPAAGDIPAQPL